MNQVYGHTCPYCKTFSSPDEIVVIKSRQRKAKLQGFKPDDYQPITLLEIGCLSCGGIYFDVEKFRQDIQTQFAQRQAK